MTYTAFIFDLDGVITDTADFHFRAWKTLANRLDIAFDQRDNERLKGVDRMASLEMILNMAGRDYSLKEKERLCVRKNADYQTLISEMSPKDVFPGVLEILARLRKKNIRLGLASASKNAGYVLDRLGLTNKFDYVADSNLIRNNKPDPEIFLAVACALNIPPAECVGIEDAVAGITAIKSAGMFAVGIGDANILTQADIIFPDIAHLNLDKILL